MYPIANMSHLKAFKIIFSQVIKNEYKMYSTSFDKTREHLLEISKGTLFCCLQVRPHGLLYICLFGILSTKEYSSWVQNYKCQIPSEEHTLSVFSFGLQDQLDNHLIRI